MIKEVRKVKDQKKQRHIYNLFFRHRIKKYIHNGRLAYDTDELKEYDKHAMRGRPIKQDDGEEIW